MLARKFDLGVVYANITSPKRGYYRIHFEVITDNAMAMPENAITLRYASLIEANIRQQPERWLWTHNRWKWAKPC
jgi:KDO2-lipid IV(A) lauroyltransferase